MSDDRTLAGGGQPSADETFADESEAGCRVHARELAPGDLVGRYVVLSKLGAGGMGVVYAAYDPELDRKVAVKLLRSDPDGGSKHSEGRSRLLREAQALAKFAHPEIVGIHDVGEHEAGVWLAMEFVDGQTLGEWARASPRTWREVVHVMIAAGRGVAAAHAAGLIHRDLKPDNIMLGVDGRVRVMDFGLTRAHGASSSPSRSGREPSSGRSGELEPGRHELLSGPLTQHGSLLGTPAYMAPEQFAAIDVTAAADQFSFCVTCWELLFGERPFSGRSMVELASSVLDGQIRAPSSRGRVPSWLRRVCERGLARDPNARWPSMEQLIAELARGQSRARKQWIAGGVLGVAAIGAGVAGWGEVDERRRIGECEAEGASIEVLWNDEGRERVRAGLLATRLSYAQVSADNVIPYLDEQARAWQQFRTTACLNAKVDRIWDESTLDRAVWCLDERRMEFDSLVAELERADSQVAQRSVTAAAGLTKVSPCLDERVLRSLPSPPEERSRAAAKEVRTQLAHAAALAAAGKYPDGLELARAARQEAEQLDSPPLLAAALLGEAALVDGMGEYGEAEQLAGRAYLTAAKASAWGLADDAAMSLAFNVGYAQARAEPGRLWVEHAEIAASFAGDPLGSRESRRLHTLAGIHFGLGEFAEAKQLYAQSLELRERLLGPDHPGLAGSLNNLAATFDSMEEFDEAMALDKRALELWERALGPDHPTVSNSLNNLATVHYGLGEFDEARSQYERALAIREQSFGPEHVDVAVVLNNLGLLAAATGETSEAISLHTRALAIREKALGGDHPLVASTLHNLGIVHAALGEFTEAKALYGRARVIRETSLGPDHADVAAMLDDLSIVEARLGNHTLAMGLNARALAMFEQAYGPKHLDVAVAVSNRASLFADAGEFTEAKRLHERALEIREAELGGDHHTVANSLAGLAAVDLRLGFADAALESAERAVAIYDLRVGDQEGELEARFTLAKALSAADGDRTRARAQATHASDGYRRLGAGRTKDLAEIEAWLDREASP